MVETLLPAVVWLVIGALSFGAGLVSVVLANRRFRLVMGQEQTEIHVAPNHVRSAPVTKVA